MQSKDGNMIADIGGKAKVYIKESTDASHISQNICTQQDREYKESLNR